MNGGVEICRAREEAKEELGYNFIRQVLVT